MGYSNPIWVVILFVFAWFATFDSRPLTDKQVTMLTRNIDKWDSAPKVEAICEGKVWRKDNVTTFKFKYDSPSGALCDAEYKIKVDQNNAKMTQHKFECTEIPIKEPEEADFD
uniref:Sensor-type histidine kinase prrB n=1 Tax=Lygus hesperus TaxID=30085 RepID=A0A0A9WK07_LYGHE